MIAKFDGLEHRRCEDIKGIVAPEIGPKNFETFDKPAPDPIVSNFFDKKEKELSPKRDNKADVSSAKPLSGQSAKACKLFMVIIRA